MIPITIKCKKITIRPSFIDHVIPVTAKSSVTLMTPITQEVRSQIKILKSSFYGIRKVIRKSLEEEGRSILTQECHFIKNFDDVWPRK